MQQSPNGAMSIKKVLILFSGIPGHRDGNGNEIARISYENIYKNIVAPNLSTHDFRYAIATDKVTEESINSIYNQENRVYKILIKEVGSALLSKSNIPVNYWPRVVDFLETFELNEFDIIIATRPDLTLSRPFILSEEFNEKDFLDISGNLVRDHDFHNRDHGSFIISDVKSLRLYSNSLFNYSGPDCDIGSLERYKQKCGLLGHFGQLASWNSLHVIESEGYNYRIGDSINIFFGAHSLLRYGAPWPCLPTFRQSSSEPCAI